MSMSVLATTTSVCRLVAASSSVRRRLDVTARRAMTSSPAGLMGRARLVNTSAGGGGGGGVTGGGSDVVVTEGEYAGMAATDVLQDVTRKLMDCRKRKAAANAVDLLVGLGRAGIEPDLLASTACLGACVAGGKMELAGKVFEEVFEKGVVAPDEVVFTELMRGHLAADPPAWARVMGLLSRMPDYDVDPTALTYNLLLGKCADDNELERAEGLIERMVEEGVEPDGRTLDAVKKRRSIRSFAKKMLVL